MSSPKHSERIRLKRLLSGIEGTLSSEYPSDQLDSVGVGATASKGCNGLFLPF